MQWPFGAGSENAPGQPGAFASRAASFAFASATLPPSTDVSPPSPAGEPELPPLDEVDDDPPSESLTEAEEPPQAPMTHTASVAAPTRILSS